MAKQAMQEVHMHYMSQMRRIEDALFKLNIELIFGADGNFRRVHEHPIPYEVTDAGKAALGVRE